MEFTYDKLLEMRSKFLACPKKIKMNRLFYDQIKFSDSFIDAKELNLGYSSWNGIPLEIDNAVNEFKLVY